MPLLVVSGRIGIPLVLDIPRSKASFSISSILCHNNVGNKQFASDTDPKDFLPVSVTPGHHFRPPTWQIFRRLVGLARRESRTCETPLFPCLVPLLSRHFQYRRRAVVLLSRILSARRENTAAVSRGRVATWVRP